MIMKIFFCFTICICFCIISFFIGSWWRWHTLAEADKFELKAHFLVDTSSGTRAQGQLPPGTVIYYHSSIPQVDSYFVFINISPGEDNIEKRNITKYFNEKIPLVAEPIK